MRFSAAGAIALIFSLLIHAEGYANSDFASCAVLKSQVEKKYIAAGIQAQWDNYQEALPRLKARVDDIKAVADDFLSKLTRVQREYLWRVAGQPLSLVFPERWAQARENIQSLIDLAQRNHARIDCRDPHAEALNRGAGWIAHDPQCILPANELLKMPAVPFKPFSFTTSAFLGSPGLYIRICQVEVLDRHWRRGFEQVNLDELCWEVKDPTEIAFMEKLVTAEVLQKSRPSPLSLQQYLEANLPKDCQN